MANQVLFSDDEYEIRPAKNTDEFRDMWWGFMQELGWDRGYYDLDSYMNPSLASGMILLIHKPTNKPCGHVSAVVNSNNTGWIAMFIIDKPHRGKGMGAKLFSAAMADFERLGTKFRGLDAVPEQKATYGRRGFVESPLGTVNIMVRPLLAKKSLPEGSKRPEVKGKLVALKDVPPQLLAAHELKYTGFDRPKLWSEEHMFRRPDVRGYAVVTDNPPKTVEDVKAWALMRRCSGGGRIGPVYADTPEYSKAVLLAVMEACTADYIKSVLMPKDPFSDLSNDEVAATARMTAEVWCGNPAALALFEEMGWEYAGAGYHRMWVDGKATAEFSEGGLAQEGVFAVFDAAIG